MSTTVTAPTQAGSRTRLLSWPVIAWGLWDWGSAAFNAVITTFVFTVYLVSDSFGAKADNESALSLGLAIAGLFIALLAPVTGQRSDRGGRTVFWLGGYTAVVVAVSAALFLVRPAPGYLWLGIVLLGVGNIFFELASVNYNAILNHLASKDRIGAVSGLGWGMGYLGGIVLLLILYVGLIGVNLLNVPTDEYLPIRISMVIAALWLGGFAIPVILHPPMPKKVHTGGDDESIIDSYKLLWRTVRTLKNEAPHTLFFLIASAVFRDGLAGVFTFGAVLAKTAFGFTAGQVMIFAIAANIVAGLATVAFGWVDDKIGPKKVIILSLSAMVVAGFGVFFLHARGPIVFWTLGLALCVFVGPTQSASRSFLSRIIPAGREGEVFGLYATTGRAVSFMAPAMYSLFLMLGKRMTPAGEDYTYWGILGIMLILGFGLALTIPVKADRATLHHMEG